MLVTFRAQRTKSCFCGIKRPKMWLHKQFFACDGDAIFLKIATSPACGENCMCSHPRTGDTTTEKLQKKNHEKFKGLNFFTTQYKLVASPVRGWLHIRLSSSTDIATFSKNCIYSPSQAKNHLRSCSLKNKYYLT